MSHLHGDNGVSSSSQVPRPFFSQSSIPSFRSHSLPQQIFGQKLIPRDFLAVRSKPSSTANTAFGPDNSASETPFYTNPFRKDREPQIGSRDTAPTYSSHDEIGPTEQSTIENGARPDDGLRNTKLRSRKYTGLSTPIAKARSASDFCPSTSDPDFVVSATMPRTSSIDSAISNVSATSLNRAAGDLREPSPASVRSLIATAGGAENLVIHLLKDKNSVVSQNAQLWKLVDKQRALLLGLNKDLERLTKERDRYKKRAKELETHTIAEDGEKSQSLPQSSVNNYIPTTNTRALDERLMNMTKAGDKMNTNSSQVETYIPMRQGHEDQNKENIPAVQATRQTLPELYIVHPEHPENPSLSITKPSLEISSTGPPTFNVIDASPLVEKPSKSLPSVRKAPPKPLNLGAADTQPTTGTAAALNDEESDRGRRRTREEDDRDREMSAIKAEAEAEARSRSKKNKVPKLFTNDENQTAPQIHVPAPLPTPGLPLSPRPQHAPTFAAPGSHLGLNIPQPLISQTGSLGERLLAAPLKSPGLPLSPRPFQRNDNQPVALSLPLSPRANMGAFPLSPRAPKHALPLPTNPAAPTDAAALQNKQSRGYQSSPQTGSTSLSDRLHEHQPVGADAPPVYRGLAVSAYPNLLLPPNALPSIKVEVHSSRLRPSRYSVLGLKQQDETTVFSLSIISRSSNSELWRIEKIPAALPQLEQHLKNHCSELPKMPDRRLFAGGQSPTLLDERRTAIDRYFDELLDIHVDEQAAVAICRFLSTDVINPEQQAKNTTNAGPETVTSSGSPTGPSTKTGYLTKKGKNFGGWKSRFFILDGTELRYYESAGGPHLGSIRLQNALIGKQKDSEGADDGEGQYRHAFLIQEPKRKDPGNYVRHVLCAESDFERDDWVRFLLYWVDSASAVATRNNSATSTGLDTTDEDNRRQGSKAGQSSKESRDTHPNTPTPTSGSSIDSSILDHGSPSKPPSISGPSKGNVITDNAAWGYKSPTITLPKDIKDKTHKMSNIFGFKRPDAAPPQPEQKPPKPRILRHNGYVRPVFGLPLAEAVEYCAPFNVEVNLPAVVYRSIEYLRHCNAANEEGLFRLSGSNVVVRNLKERFNVEGDINLVREDEYHDVHAVASLFKSYLRELPSTLLTRELHLEFIKVLELETNAEKVAAFNTLVHSLPPANFSLLKELSEYLLEVTRNADKNKMSIRNVGIVFSPTLNIPTPVFTLFLTEYAAIFEQVSGAKPAIRSTEIAAPQSLTPDDIRSPRHQMFSDLATPAYNQTTFQVNSQVGIAPPRGTMTGTGELGFLPIHSAFDSNSHAPAPRNASGMTAQPLSQIADVGGYGSLNGLLAPSNAPTERAKKRESTMMFFNNNN